jgi:hypothetical protein
MYADPWTPHGLALHDYFGGDASATVIVHSDLGEREELPVAVWFREPAQFWALERAALELCRGRVLDVGAGTGCHSLALQELGLEVVAIDFIPEAVEIMRARGVRDARRADLFRFVEEPFDTLLLLSNGAGIAETLSGLARLLERLNELVAPGGQVLMDSTDVRPGASREGSGRLGVGAQGRERFGETAAADETEGRVRSEISGQASAPRGAVGLKREDGRYVGEIQFQLEYRGEKAPPFPQLYVDPETLAAHAARGGWSCEVVERGEGGGYLARLTRVASTPKTSYRRR